MPTKNKQNQNTKRDKSPQNKSKSPHKSHDISMNDGQSSIKKNSRNPRQIKQLQQVARSVAEIQLEVNQSMHEVLIEILSDTNQSVKSAHIKTFVNLMFRYYKCFKQSFMEFIDKIIVFDEKDAQIKGVYKLLEKFYSECAKNPNLNQIDANSLVNTVLNQLVEIYCIAKLSLQANLRAAFMLTQVVGCFNLPLNEKIKLDSDLKYQLSEVVIDMLQSSRTTVQIYGIQLASHLGNQNKQNDQLYLYLMKTMTQSKSREVRRASLNHIKGPFNQTTLIFISKRLRDKDEDVRRIAFQKLYRNDVKLESFTSPEQRMLIIKEGLTDQSEFVRAECIEFIKPSLFNEDGSLKELSQLFKLIDCKKLFIKEYYVQLPFIIMRFIFHCFENEEIKIAQYLETILNKLKIQAGLVQQENQEMQDDNSNQKSNIEFEDLLFLRIAYEFTKMYKRDRNQEYIDHVDNIQLDFNEYHQIFNYLLNNYPMVNVPLQNDQKTQNQNQSHKFKPDRLVFSEWMKFSLQLSIEEEMTRRNLVSLMFNYIGKIEYSYDDYKYLLNQKRFLIQENNNYDDQNNDQMQDGMFTQIQRAQRKSLDLYNSDQEDEDDNSIGNLREDEQQVIEIEIRGFQDLNVQKDIQEYCKPFSFESLVLDSDDICRIAVIVARKLLDSRIDEFSLSMLQAISDIKEPIEENGDENTLNYKREKDKAYQKLEQKLETVNEIILQEDYSIQDLNRTMKKVKYYVNLIEEIILKEKLSYKRALNMCLILLKQCRADVNDQNMVQICDTLIGPTIKSKDQDNMLLAIECIGLLCLLDKEVFQNYAKIFQRILVEDVIQDNLREKIIALRSSVDSLIIHGVDAKTQKLQKIIIEDYMVIKDKVLRQITIEGICKMLFSRKLTQSADNDEMEFLLSQLIIQWFDKKFNWQNSLVRQILNTFFKSFVLFSQQRCEIMMNALTKTVYSILEAKYGEQKPSRKQQQVKINQKGKNGRQSHVYDDSESEDYSIDEEEEYNSDDSRCALNQAKMHKIVAQLDPVQITKVFMLLLSKDYVNANAAKQFKLSKNLNLEFLIFICYLNAYKFKKVVIVKEYISPIIDYINVNQCTDMKQLEVLYKYLDLNLKMLVQNNQKLKRMKECIENRIVQLLKEENEYAQLINREDEEYLEKSQEEMDVFVLQLQNFYDDEIYDTLVDLVKDDDEEYQEINQVQVNGILDKSMTSPYGLKNKSKNRLSNDSNLNSDSHYNQTGRMLRKRRSGLRSNKKQQQSKQQQNQQAPYTVIQNTKKLKAIPEVDDIKDMSSSEKPVIRNKLYETIIEERDDIDLEDYRSSSSDFKQSNDHSSQIKRLSQQVESMDINDPLYNQQYDNHNEDSLKKLHSQLQRDRETRRGIMSKISKKMARDYEQNKKKSLMLSQSGSSCTQINEQRLREDYSDGRTVYKISKQRSISPLDFQRRQDNKDMQRKDSIDGILNQDLNVSHNLSVRFDNIHDSDQKDTFKNLSYQQENEDESLSLKSLKQEMNKIVKNNNKKPSTRGGKKSQQTNNQNVKKNQYKSSQSYESISEFDEQDEKFNNNRINIKQNSQEEMISSSNSTYKSLQQQKQQQQKSFNSGKIRSRQQKQNEELKKPQVSKSYYADQNFLNVQNNVMNSRMTRNRMRSISQSSPVNDNSVIKSTKSGRSQNRNNKNKQQQKYDIESQISDSSNDDSNSNSIDVFDIMKSKLSRKINNNYNNNNKIMSQSLNNSNQNIHNNSILNNSNALNNQNNKSFNQRSNNANNSLSNNYNRDKENKYESSQNKNMMPTRGIMSRIGKRVQQQYDQYSSDEESDMIKIQSNKFNKENQKIETNKGGQGQKKGSVRGKK